MKLLITGGTGFVGRNLWLAALNSGRYDRIFLPVRDLARFEKQVTEEGLSAEQRSVLSAFVSSAENWNLGEAASSDHVVHCAGVIFARTQAEYTGVNVDGTLSLLGELKAPSRVVLLSSLAAAGPSAPGKPHKACGSEAPVTWYGKSKLEMERRVAERFPDLSYLVLRPPMIFGPRDQATLPLFKMMNKPVHFKAGLGSKYYSVLGVEDLCQAVLCALQSPQEPRGEVYYVAHDEVVTDSELLRSAARVCGRASRVVPVPQTLLKLASRVIDGIPTWRKTIPSLSVDRAREIWPDFWEVSSEPFKERFGWQAQTPLEGALAGTREWYLRTGELSSSL